MDSRRNFLTMLGLAPTALIGAETITKGNEKPDIVTAPTDVDAESMARAFRALAEAIANRDLHIASFVTQSSMKPGNVMTHTMTVDMFFKT